MRRGADNFLAPWAIPPRCPHISRQIRSQVELAVHPSNPDMQAGRPGTELLWPMGCAKPCCDLQLNCEARSPDPSSCSPDGRWWEGRPHERHNPWRPGQRLFFFSLKSFLKGYIVFSNWGGLWKEILHRGRPRVGCHPLAVLPGDRVPVRIVEKKRGEKEKKEEKGEGIFPYYSDICR